MKLEPPALVHFQRMVAEHYAKARALRERGKSTEAFYAQDMAAALSSMERKCRGYEALHIDWITLHVG